MAEPVNELGPGDIGTMRRVLSLASLSHTRALLRARRARGWAFDLAILYAFVSTLIGGMLEISSNHKSLFVEVIPTGSPWWDYPAVVAIVPGIRLSLPFLPALAMILVSAGVGIGVTAAILLFFPGIRAPREEVGGETSPAAGAGAAPSITGLATMGACCCTSCAGAAGVAVVAAASGTDPATLIRENWYVSLFQVIVVGVSLFAAERALRITPDICTVPPPKDWKFAIGAILRIALLIAGVTWSLAMFIEWGVGSSTAASAVTWYHWTVEHQILSLTGIAAGMFPREFATWIKSTFRRLAGWALRASLLIGGITWSFWVPPAMSHIGLGGFLNELFGSLGAPTAWGAIVPDSALGPALVFHWAFQHVLLGAFAIFLALLPERAMAPLTWTVEGPRPSFDAPVTTESV